MRAVIVGGGVVGCATAIALAERGADVVVVERGAPGGEASSAAAGILGAQVEARENAALLPLFVRARAEYGDWAEELRERTGVDIAHRVTGGLRVAAPGREEDARAIRDEVDWQREQGLRAELVDGRGARAIEPALAESIETAAHYPDESQVDPRALVRSLVAAIALPFEGGGCVTMRAETAVARLIVERDRCVGVALEGPEAKEERGDVVVLAAGSWSSLLPALPSSVPAVSPVRGQMVQLEERAPSVRTMVFGPDAYVVPRGDGRVLCGSTLEHVGHARGVTAEGVSGILSGALRIVPALATASIASMWSGFRPFMGEHAPWMGESPIAGLFLATGHYRNGILLAKVTADAVARAIYG
jgi:glycine oxidase